jgi:hypothetical protein
MTTIVDPQQYIMNHCIAEYKNIARLEKQIDKRNELLSNGLRGLDSEHFKEYFDKTRTWGLAQDSKVKERD